MTVKIKYHESVRRLEQYNKPLLGSIELAMVLGLHKVTLSARHKKRDISLPKPYVELGMGPCWRKQDVAKWLKTAPPVFLEFGRGSVGH